LPVVSQQASLGARVKLDGKRARPLLIEVFASWCGTCKRSAPALADAYATYGNDLDFLGVSVDDSRQAALQAKQDWRIPYQVAHDDRGVFAQQYRVRVLPTFILLDEEGLIREVSAGMPGRSRLSEWAEAVTQQAH
jgi:thiol-disulfide isomerase/thioredoxin